MKSWLNILGIDDKGSFWNMTVTIVYNKRGLLTICTLFSSSCGIEKEGRLLCPIGQAPAWKRSKVIPSLYHYVQRSIQKIWKNNLTNNIDWNEIFQRANVLICYHIIYDQFKCHCEVKLQLAIFGTFKKVKQINMSYSIRAKSNLWQSNFFSHSVYSWCSFYSKNLSKIFVIYISKFKSHANSM